MTTHLWATHWASQVTTYTCNTPRYRAMRQRHAHLACWRSFICIRQLSCVSLPTPADAKMVRVDPYRVTIAGGKGGQVGGG